MIRVRRQRNEASSACTATEETERCVWTFSSRLPKATIPAEYTNNAVSAISRLQISG